MMIQEALYEIVAPLKDKFLSSQNYEDWRFHMTWSLISQGLWHVVRGQHLSEITLDKDYMVSKSIKLTIEYPLSLKIWKATFCSSQELWDYLRFEFGKDNQHNKQQQKSQIEQGYLEKSGAETQVTGEVVELGNEAIEKCIPLWYQMQLGGQQLDINEDQIVMEETSPAAGFHPLVDLCSWHFKLLKSLANLFSTLSPTDYIKPEEVMIAIQFEAGALHKAFMNNTNCSQISRFPATNVKARSPFQLWIEYSAPMENDRPQIVDWRALIVTLINLDFNYCFLASSLEDICSDLQERTLEYDGLLTLENFLETWFWSDADSNQEGFKLGVKIKNLWYTMLKTGNQLVSLRTLILSLCREVFLGIAGDRPELKQEELLAAIYHDDMEEACSVGCATWTNADLDDLLATMEREEKNVKDNLQKQENFHGFVEQQLEASSWNGFTSESSERLIREIWHDITEKRDVDNVIFEDNNEEGWFKTRANDVKVELVLELPWMDIHEQTAAFTSIITKVSEHALDFPLYMNLHIPFTCTHDGKVEDNPNLDVCLGYTSYPDIGGLTKKLK